VSEAEPESGEVRTIGRYALHAEIASGGMARIHLGRLVGPAGFARTVAIKRLHSSYAADPEFVAMFLDEARVAARIRHPNVVPILDVVALKGELFMVLEYVRGESLGRLLSASAKTQTPIPPEIVATIVIGMLEGLHAAHEREASTVSRSRSSTATSLRRTSSSASTASRACSTSASRRPPAGSRRRGTAS
jgi:serine/threonine-protein kinase